MIGQRGLGLGERLANAHADTHARCNGSGGAVLQIGMDTPQVTAGLLGAALTAAASHDAVLGPASDGGWWALAVADARMTLRLSGVVMSTPETGDETRAVLESEGADVHALPVLRDVDEWTDALAVAGQAPGGRFAAAVAERGGYPVTAAPQSRARVVHAPDHHRAGSVGGLTLHTAYARALSGEECAVVGDDGSIRPLPARRWLEAADASDRALFVTPCSGPTLDVGCGPGRLLIALAGARRQVRTASTSLPRRSPGPAPRRCVRHARRRVRSGARRGRLVARAAGGRQRRHRRSPVAAAVPAYASCWPLAGAPMSSSPLTTRPAPA